MVAIVASLMMLLVLAPSSLQLRNQQQQQSNEELPEPEEDRGEEIEKDQTKKAELDEQRVVERHVVPLPTLCRAPEIITVVSVAPPLHPSQFSVRRLI